MIARVGVRIMVLAGLFTFLCLTANSQDLKELRRQANKAIKREHFAEAIPLLKKLVANDSLNSEILFNLSLAMAQTEDYHGCIKYATRGIAVDSTDAAHYFRRGLCYSGIRDYSLGINDFTKAIELDSQSSTFFNRAIARWKSGDASGGIADFTTALTLEPEDELGLYYRALCYLETGDTTNAINDLDSAIVLKPKDPDLFEERGFLRFQNKNYPGAKADYLRCVELDQAYVLAHLSLSEIALITGKWLEAYHHASNAVRYASNKDERSVGLIFKCAANKLMKKSTSTDEGLLNKALEDLEETTWNFDDLQQALKKQQISDETSLYISRLIKTYYGE